MSLDVGQRIVRSLETRGCGTNAEDGFLGSLWVPGVTEDEHSGSPRKLKFTVDVRNCYRHLGSLQTLEVGGGHGHSGGSGLDLLQVSVTVKTRGYCRYPQSL